MAVFDYLQGPISNLVQNYDISDYNFPFSLTLLTPPLTPIQQQFHTFITNALYFALPNFRALKVGLLQPKLKDSLDRSLPIIILCMMILVGIVLGMTAMLILSCRLMKVRNNSFKFI